LFRSQLGPRTAIRSWPVCGCLGEVRDSCQHDPSKSLRQRELREFHEDAQREQISVFHYFPITRNLAAIKCRQFSVLGFIRGSLGSFYSLRKKKQMMGMAVWMRLVDLSGAGQKAAIAGNGSRANVCEFGQWTDVCQQWIGVDGGIGTVIRAHRAIEHADG
jgi:hypothetical protein